MSVAVTNNVGTPRCLDLTASNAYAASAAQPSLVAFSNGTSDQPFSISAWVYFVSTGVIKRVVTLMGPSGSPFYYSLGVHTNDKLRFTLYSAGVAGNNIYIESQNAITQNAWVHVAVSYDGGIVNTGLQMYLNGTLEASPTRSTTGTTYVAMSAIAATDKLFVGGTPQAGSNFYWNNKLDGVCVWSKVFSQADITELYNAGKVYNPTYHSAAAYLKYCGRFENNLTDSSASGYNLTAVGVVAYSTSQP